MSSITVGSPLQEVLERLEEVTEIRDANGRILGHFNPTHETEKELYERAKKLFDLAEVEERERREQGQGRTLDQIWERLRSMEQPK